jgi:exonuclease VII small subunit
MSRFEELADRLDAIVSELDELAFDQLSEAVHEGATARPDADKQLEQARRAVEKAAHVLRQITPP